MQSIVNVVNEEGKINKSGREFKDKPSPKSSMFKSEETGGGNTGFEGGVVLILTYDPDSDLAHI
jgi:hypothetical protein